MKALAITSLSAAALALAGCGPKATGNADAGGNEAAIAATNSTAPAPAATGGQAFANAAAASDAFEIASSRLALTSASSSAIKRYAQKMIDAHTDSTAQLKTAAASASPAITPDPSLTADQQAKLDALMSLSGKAFDQAYAAAQTEGHQKTLDTLRSYAGSGDVPSLKAFATTITPIVAAHLNMAKSLKV